MSDVLARADWQRRSAELGELREVTKGEKASVAMVLRARTIGRLWELWRDLPPHPHVVDPVGPIHEGHLLHYAAIDWDPPALDVAQLATLGVALTRIGDLLGICIEEKNRGYFALPKMWLDLDGEPRVAFRIADDDVELGHRLPPEVAATWPACDERGMIYVIGQVLRDLVPETDSPLSALVTRCMDPDPSQRFETITQVRVALVKLGGYPTPRNRLTPIDAWTKIETGIGYLNLGMPNKAQRWFDAVIERHPYYALARAGRSEAIRLGGMAPSKIAWSDVRDQCAALEARGDYRDALVLYATVESSFDSELAHARCLVALGDHGPALDHVQRALHFDPAHDGALTMRVELLLRTRKFADALTATASLAASPDRPRAHHLRGKCLLALGRLPEARDAFERASPLLEAMLLRREVDRVMGVVRASAGTSSPLTLKLPDHLAELRDVLVSGRIHDAIALLRRPAYDDDPVAQLLLAELCTTDGDLDAALTAYRRAATVDQSPAPRLGIARTLHALDRAAEALVVLEPLDVIDALELRARALAAVGRHADADAMMQRYVAAIARGAELRTRNA